MTLVQPADEKKADKLVTVTVCPGTGTRPPGRSGRGRHHGRRGEETGFPPLESREPGKGSVKGEEESRGRRRLRERERGFLLSGPNNAGMKRATLTTSPISIRRRRNSVPPEEWCLARELTNDIAIRNVTTNSQCLFYCLVAVVHRVFFARLPCHRCVSALSNGSVPFSLGSFSPPPPPLEFGFFFYSGGGIQPNDSNCSKQENGAARPILDGRSPFLRPQWPSSTLCLLLSICGLIF